ncbi:MAG: hypothetical protein IJN97_00350 [Oscillospiraceae bacterium]|nr:hypothetical protein [Oscillospiraceae bacterium]MBQ7053650.1 hypothetical protein [Oscillospiraceae bacterium]
MARIWEAVDKVLSRPVKEFTRQEAQSALRSCGILNKNNEVVKAYRDIVVPATEE